MTGNYSSHKLIMETVEELKKERLAIVEAISEMAADVSRVEIHEMFDEIAEIDRKIHAIDPTQV